MKILNSTQISIQMIREMLRDHSRTWVADRKNQILMKEYDATKCWSLVVQLCCSYRISSICRQLPFKSLCFSVLLCEGWIWLLLIRRSKLKNSSTKWKSTSQIWRVDQQNHSFLANWTNWALSSHYSLWILDILPAHLCIPVSSPQFHCALWSAFGLPRKLLHSPTLSLTFSRLFSHPASLCLPYLCQLLSQTQFQKAFSLNAGATKEVSSPAAHKVIWHGAGATRSWLHSPSWSKSFAEIKKCLKAKIFAIQMIGESLRDHSRTRIVETKQVHSWLVKGSGACTHVC